MDLDEQKSAPKTRSAIVSAANAEEDIGWKTKNEGFHLFMAFSYKYFFAIQLVCCKLLVAICV